MEEVGEVLRARYAINGSVGRTGSGREEAGTLSISLSCLMRWLGVKMTAGGSWEGLEVVIIMILGGLESSVWWKVCMTCIVINLKI